MPSANAELSTREGLAAACRAVLELNREKRSYLEWKAELVPFLIAARDADLDRRASKSFLTDVWDRSPVSAVGQGNVSMDRLLDDESFRQWFAALTLEPLPAEGEVRTAELERRFEQTLEKVSPFCERTPRLKAFRVFAAFFPKDFTTIAHGKKVRRLHSAMGLGQIASTVHAHRTILNRLAEVLGPVGDSLEETAERMMLPWLLFADALTERNEDVTERPGDVSGEAKLVPLPAARRRRGLTAFGGGLALIIGVLDFVSEGVTRDELMDHIRSTHSGLRDSAIGILINCLLSEFAVIRRDGASYRLTDRGAALLESEDPDELCDWLLTHILGVDHVLVWLRDRVRIPRRALVSELQAVNPGWTTTYAPNALLGWLKTFDVLAANEAGSMELTVRGREWAQRVEWVPGKLEPAPELTVESTSGTAPESDRSVRLPVFDEIYKHVSAKGAFDRKQVANLHTGLWLHKRRHFAVLTGLSGSGKTLLAMSYGAALSRDAGAAARRVLCVPVQPGWYDPSALLGCLNPLKPGTYMRTPFLEFVLRATMDSGNAYTVVLDEMNLSRPEQYLAPLLSGMETGSPLMLHQEADELEGVPAELEYPENLVLVGTVNMDESTHGLSDKVLDRAYTLEFWKMDLDKYPRWGTWGLSQESEETVRAVLTGLMKALDPVRLHFGWRVVDDVLSFVHRASTDTRTHSVTEALDHIVHARILPKLRGEDSQRLRDAFRQCAQALGAASLEYSAAKVRELESDLQSTGTARFWR